MAFIVCNLPHSKDVQGLGMSLGTFTEVITAMARPGPATYKYPSVLSSSSTSLSTHSGLSVQNYQYRSRWAVSVLFQKSNDGDRMAAFSHAVHLLKTSSIPPHFKKALTMPNDRETPPNRTMCLQKWLLASSWSSSRLEISIKPILKLLMWVTSASV